MRTFLRGSLRELTMFYARPLFDFKSRLGINIWSEDIYAKEILFRQERFDFPLYLDFGGGKPYRFQSMTSLGFKSWRVVPMMLPYFAAMSEFKSHLIQGILLA